MAESVTVTEPVPMGTTPVGFEEVTILEVQLPKFSSTKLFSTALVEVDERLSARLVAKHSFASPAKFVKSMPPS